MIPSAPLPPEPVEAPPLGDDPGGDRRRWLVVETRVPRAERTVARELLATDDDVAARGYRDIHASDVPDDHAEFPLGHDAVFAVDLTDDEATRYLAQDHVVAVDPDSHGYATTSVDAGSAAAAPTAAASLSFLRASAAALPGASAWHGRDQLIAIIDSGTTAAVRAALGVTLVGRSVFGDDPSPNEVFSGQIHGCLVAGNGVPAGGRLLDLLITTASTDGTASTTTSATLAALNYAGQQGAKVINLSYAGYGDSTAWGTVFSYLQGLGAVVTISAGNSTQNSLPIPAGYSRTYPNVLSVIAFDETTNDIASFSNYTSDSTCCSPGVNLLSLNADASPAVWNGTSGAAPLVALCLLMGATAGRFTAAQVAAALKANLRDTGQLPTYQGGGAADLRRALAALGAVTPNLPRRQLCATPRPDFGLAGWFVDGTSAPTAPQQSSTGGSPVGTLHALVTVNADGYLDLYGPAFLVTPGQAYTASVFYRHNRSIGAYCYVMWYDANGRYLTYSPSPTAPVAPAGEQRRISTAGVVAPAAAYSARGLLYLPSAGSDLSTPDEIRYTGWLYEVGGLVEPYFDGSYAPYAQSYWDGGVGASTSLLGTGAAVPSPDTPAGSEQGSPREVAVPNQGLTSVARGAEQGSPNETYAGGYVSTTPASLFDTASGQEAGGSPETILPGLDRDAVAGLPPGSLPQIEIPPAMRGTPGAPQTPGPRHFAMPAALTPSGSYATVGQDSTSDVVQCVQALLRTRVGELIEVPEFGIPDPTFMAVGQHWPTVLESAVAAWEKRAAGAAIPIQINEDGTATVVVPVPPTPGGPAV